MITTDTLPKADRRCTDCEQFLRLLHAPGDVLEIRALNCPTNKGSDFTATASGYFSDPKLAADAARKLDSRGAPGVYVTINPVSIDLLARASNRIIDRAKNTTTDVQVVKRNWLLLDLDPVRASGISSTDAEMEDAISLAHAVIESLAADGWPAPIFGMSGNGAYCLYRIDLPNNEAATELVKGVLEGLADRLETETVKIDRGVFNASRIAKVLGTTARKGDNLQDVPGVPDRPHRVAWFEIPAAPLGVVMFAQLSAAAKVAAPKIAASAPVFANGSAGGPSIVDRCWRYIEKMPDAVSGNKGSNPTLQAACECYRFGLNDEEARGVMGRFNTTKTAGEHWSDREIEHKLADARGKVEAAGELGIRLRENRDYPAPHKLNGHQRNGQAERPSRKSDEDEATETPLRFERRTSAELASSSDEVEYIVEDIWPEQQAGIISGRFKTLKTSAAIDLAISATTGRDFLGRFPVKRAIRCGIMSAESGWKTLRERGRAVAQSKGYDLADLSGLVWSTDSPRLARTTHLDALRRFIIEDGLEGLFVDPSYLAFSDIGDSAANVFKMGSVLAPLTEIIQETGCSIILLNHNRKGRGQLEQFAPPDLGEIAMAGFAEWARFWLLLGPRREWSEDTGEHWLWLRAGGSAGHAGLWHLDAAEGKRSDPGGRRWQVSVCGATEGQQSAQAAKEAAKAETKRKAVDADKQAIIARLGAMPDGDTIKGLREKTTIRTERFKEAFAELVADASIVETVIRKPNGRTYDGYKLRPDEG